MAVRLVLAAFVVTSLLIVSVPAIQQEQEDGCCMSRTSMLEYRVAKLEARELPCMPPGATCAGTHCQRITKLPDLATDCRPGMGDDISQWYPPYLVMTHTSIHTADILCDTHTDGGGWIVIQRRAKGDVDFLRSWAAYRNGFGSSGGDFWLGNEAIHQLTHNHSYELRIDMRANGQKLFAGYSSFKLGSEADKYRLHLGVYSGTVGESNFGLSYQNSSAFTTFDNNNAVGTAVNCGLEYQGAWWYNHYCAYSNLNGLWGVQDHTGVSWKNGPGYIYPTFTEMKIRRV